MKKGIYPPNVPDCWRETEVWRMWEAPLNVIRGESVHQASLWAIIGRPDERCKLKPVEVKLIREPWNSHDPHAIRCETCSADIGHIVKELAEYLSGVMDQIDCREFSVAGIVRGGAPDAYYLGVHLWLQRLISDGPELTVSLRTTDSPCYVPWPPTPNEHLV